MTAEKEKKTFLEIGVANLANKYFKISIRFLMYHQEKDHIPT